MKVSQFLFGTVSTLVLATAAHAQDLQYRMVMHMVAPAMPATMPAQAPTMTMYYKGSSLRVDTDMGSPAPGMPNMSSSAIMDLAAHKMVVLMHSQKQYMEMPMPAVLGGPDSAGLRKNVPTSGTVKETGAVKEIGGYVTKRVLMSADFPTMPPVPGAQLREGNKFVMVGEQWLSTDPKLAEAYKIIATLMKGLGNDPITAAMAGKMPPGFPIQSTMLMVQLPKDAACDPESILKAGDKADGLFMMMNMETHDIRVGPLDAALFSIPKDYTKMPMP